MALGDVAASMLFGGRRSCMGSAMVPLDRVLLSSWVPIGCLASVMIWPQFVNFDSGFWPLNLPFLWWPGSLSDTWDHMRMSAKWHLIPSNGFSRVHECDRRPDGPYYSNVCCSRRHYGIQWCLLIILIVITRQHWIQHITFVAETIAVSQLGGQTVPHTDTDDRNNFSAG